MKQKTKTIDISHQTVKEYDPNWVNVFAQEADQIKQLLGDKVTRVEHIGSTSVPGLAAKPIIDIVVEIPSSKDAKLVAKSLATLGYFANRNRHDEYMSTERCFLIKGRPAQFHLSICYSDKGSFLERQILFRDYLREHEEEKEEYNTLKKELLQQYPTGKEEYIEGKTDFVMRILKKAGFASKWFDLSKY